MLKHQALESLHPAYNIRIIIPSRAKRKQNTITEEQNQKCDATLARIHLLLFYFQLICHSPYKFSTYPGRSRRCRTAAGSISPTCKALAPCTTPRIARAAARHRRPLVEKSNQRDVSDRSLHTYTDKHTHKRTCLDVRGRHERQRQGHRLGRAPPSLPQQRGRLLPNREKRGRA